MLVILFSLSLVTMPTVPSFAAEGSNVDWQKTYGRPADDMTWSMIKTMDGGYVMAGETQTDVASIFNAWLVKTDTYGNALWNKTYEGTFRSVIQTSDGGYAIAGIQGYRTSSDNDFLLLKTDAYGNGQWRRTFDPIKSPENQSMSSTHDYAWGIFQTADGGYALVGSTNAYDPYDDVWLVKTDANGIYMWNKTYGGPDVDYAYDVVQTADGGYAIGGGTEIPGKQMEFWLIKTDANGNALWNKTYGRADTDWLYSMIQTSDGGFALTGGYAYDASSYKGWLIKTDAFGNEQWNKTYASTFRSVVQTVDGGYAMAGVIDQGNGVYDFWFVRTDANGNEEWNQTFGGAGMDQAFSVVQATDGGYALAGYTESYGAGGRDLWLIKIKTPVIPEFQSSLIPIALVITVTLTIVLRKEH